ncbi:MAG: lipid-A-disaccharide synthase [Sedimentisphaerales bacterium]|nr:lipid-A-disaccharide synthase [Sedimentisphaerales bacterium]
MIDRTKTYRIFISAAEPSADMHCAHLITALKASGYTIECVGLGGPTMAAAGCTILENMTGRAAMHYNVLSQIGWYRSVMRRVTSYLKTTKVDLVIVCDSPAFNFYIAKIAKKSSVKTLFYVAPQLWAWGGWRIRKLRNCCDRLACILPFEQQWFKDRQVAAEFVGNPLFDDIPAEMATGTKHVFNCQKPVIALMPGSRPGEIDTLWRPMQEIATKIAQRHTGAQFITVAANEKILQTLKERQTNGFTCEYSLSSVLSTAYKADLTIVASGSATLQVAAAGCPMVIMYQSSKFLWHLVGKWLLKVPHLSLVNIVAGKELVPEFMPYFDSTEPIYQACEKLLSDTERLTRLGGELTALTQPLIGQNASEKTAKIALEML